MRYFYYVRAGGRLWPQASAIHPKDKLRPPVNLVGEVHQLDPAHQFLTLAELMRLFPEPNA